MRRVGGLRRSRVQVGVGELTVVLFVGLARVNNMHLSCFNCSQGGMAHRW